MNRLFVILMSGCLACAHSFSESNQDDLRLQKVELTGTFSILNPSRLVLSSKEYKVSYSKNLLGISAFQVGVGIPLKTQLSWLKIYSFARLGYARNQGTYNVTSLSGEALESEVTLHWVPLTAGIRAEYKIPDFDLVRPYLSVGGGVEWLAQTGSTPGVSENFWIPFYQAGLGFSFLGGFSFSMNLRNGLRQDQQANSLSYDLTAHFYL